MNESIINPMFWYWINTIPVVVQVIFIPILIALIIKLNYHSIWVFVCLMTLDDYLYSHYKDKAERFEKSKQEHIKKLPLSIALVLIPAFILALSPSKQLLIEMIVLDNITYERVEKAVNLGKDIKDVIKTDIIDIIEALKTEPKQKK